MMRTLRLLTIATFAVLHAGSACTTPPDDVARSERRAETDGSVEMALHPSNRLFLADTDVDFALQYLDVGAAAAFSESEVAVLDQRGGRVVVFDTAGRVVQTIGGPGGGPGEILFPQGLVPLHEGVGVLDGGKQAVVRYGSDGAALGQWRLDSLLGVPANRIVRMRQGAASDWFFSEVVSSPTQRFERLSVRRNGTTTPLDSTPPSVPKPITYPCNVIVESGGPPVFWPTLRWDNRGARVTSVSDVAYALRTLGDTTIAGGREMAARPATRADAFRTRLGGTVRAGNTECSLSRESALEQRTMADRIPVVKGVRVAPSGDVWVWRDVPVGEPAAIDVFDSTLQFVTTLRGAHFPIFFLSETLYAALDSTADGAIGLRLVRVIGGGAGTRK